MLLDLGLFAEFTAGTIWQTGGRYNLANGEEISMYIKFWGVPAKGSSSRWCVNVHVVVSVRSLECLLVLISKQNLILCTQCVTCGVSLVHAHSVLPLLHSHSRCLELDPGNLPAHMSLAVCYTNESRQIKVLTVPVCKLPALEAELHCCHSNSHRQCEVHTV